MDIEKRTEDLLRLLISYKKDLELNNNKAEDINFYFKLTGSKPDIAFTEIIDKEDYETVKAYIIQKINTPNFIFHSNEFDNRTKYLHISFEK